MNVNRVELERRDSGTSWIVFKDELTGAIEVYPLTGRNTEALRNFLNDPMQRELVIRDNLPPLTKPAHVCNTHGRYYNDTCWQCPKEPKPEPLNYRDMKAFLVNWLGLDSAEAGILLDKTILRHYYQIHDSSHELRGRMEFKGGDFIFTSIEDPSF